MGRLPRRGPERAHMPQSAWSISPMSGSIRFRIRPKFESGDHHDGPSAARCGEGVGHLGLDRGLANPLSPTPSPEMHERPGGHLRPSLGGILASLPRRNCRGSI